MVAYNPDENRINNPKEEFEKRNFWQNKYQNSSNKAKNSAISPPLENFAHETVNFAKFSKEKDKLTRVFHFVVYILDYLYKEITSIGKDILTEIYLHFWRHNRHPQKKILGYWDFNQRVSKLGDFLAYLEYLNILRCDFKLDQQNKNIDLCFIDDETHFNRKQPRFSQSYQFKKTLKSLFIFNKNIDSVLTFRSNREFERFYLQNKKRYIRWPPTVSGTLIMDYRAIEKFYRKNSFIPLLEVPREITTEIYRFYEARVYPALPIILNVRQNKNHNSARNSNLREIRTFLEHYEQNKTYKFVIICTKSEVPDDFRKLKNVLISKDYFSDVEQDLGLIKTSYLSIFPSSGMACFAMFSNVPFLLFGNHGYQEKFTCPKKGKSFNFLSQSQKIYHGQEKTASLISSFEELVCYLKEKEINNTAQMSFPKAMVLRQA